MISDQNRLIVGVRTWKCLPDYQAQLVTVVFATRHSYMNAGMAISAPADRSPAAG